MHNFIAFLRGLGPDANGRMLAEYLAWSPEKWESCHDHMQWAFPTCTKSAFNPNAPIVPDDFVFYGESDVVPNLEVLVTQYLNSLGIVMSYDEVIGYTFTYPSTWGDMNRLGTIEFMPYWAHSGDHNMLRITRVLESLGIFGMTELQTAVHDFFVYTIAPSFGAYINAKTVAFWVAAKENKLHLLR